MQNDLIDKLVLKLLQEKLSPFRYTTWQVLNKPITKKEIREAIKNKQFISPKSKPVKDIDNSTREEHIQRIAWLVKNYDRDNYPIDVDFGIPETEAKFCVLDGCHRLAGAVSQTNLMIFKNEI